MLMGKNEARNGFRGFLKRFEEGHPWKGVMDTEDMNRYGEAARKASPADYQQAACDAFGRLSETDRGNLGSILISRAENKGIDLSGLTQSPGQGFGDAVWLSNIAAKLHQRPALLRKFF